MNAMILCLGLMCADVPPDDVPITISTSLRASHKPHDADDELRAEAKCVRACLDESYHRAALVAEAAGTYRQTDKLFKYQAVNILITDLHVYPDEVRVSMTVTFKKAGAKP